MRVDMFNNQINDIGESGSDSKEGRKMQILMRLRDRLERMMAAVAFAEAGCFDTARTIMGEGARPKSRRPVARKRPSAEQRPVLRV